MLRSAKALAAILSVTVLATTLAASSASAAMLPRTTPGTSPNFPVRVFYQQFNRPLQPHTWSIYQGRPTCCPDSLWAKSHVLARNGALRIRTYRDPAFGNAWPIIGRRGAASQIRGKCDGIATAVARQ